MYDYETKVQTIAQCVKGTFADNDTIAARGINSVNHTPIMLVYKIRIATVRSAYFAYIHLSTSSYGSIEVLILLLPLQLHNGHCKAELNSVQKKKFI